MGIDVEGKEVFQVAKELCDELEKTFSNVDGEMPFTKRVPEATLEQWRKDDIVPRGAMVEIMELMSRTHIGCDQDYNNLMKQISRTALADGWEAPWWPPNCLTFCSAPPLPPWPR